MAVGRSSILMLMIASFSSATLAILLALSVGQGSMLITSVPGFAVGGFFAFRYATFERSKAKEEQNRRSRNKRRH